jgi:hypothetical protein
LFRRLQVKEYRNRHRVSGAAPEGRPGTAWPSSIAITMDIYSRLMPNMQGEAAAAVDVALRAAISKRDDVG